MIGPSSLQDSNPRKTPAVKPLLIKSNNGKDQIGDFNFRSSVGHLSYLVGWAHPDVSMTVHQASKFSINHKYFHDNSFKWTGKYLKGTNHKGLILKPDLKKALETRAGAEFAGAHGKDTSEDPSTVHSRSWFISKHYNFPMTWKSNLQTQVAL